MAKISKLPDFTVLPDLDVDFLENRQNRRKLCKNAKIGDSGGFLGISTSKSGDTVKSGNFGILQGILAISATLPDGSNSKSPKIGQKRQNWRFLGEIPVQIW